MGERGRGDGGLRRSVQGGVIEGVLTVAFHLIRTSKSKTFSVKIRTLVRYGYTSYVYGTREFKRIKGLASRVNMPKNFANPYFYNKIEKELKRNFKVYFENRGKIRYAVFFASKPPI